MKLPELLVHRRGAAAQNSPRSPALKKWAQWVWLATAGIMLSGALAWGAVKAPPVKAAPPGPSIVWPTPNRSFLQGGDLSSWAQDTGTGDPHSGLFGCVRDDGHKFHEGIDIKCTQRDKKGEPTDPIYAAMDGQVVYINNTPGTSNYGRYIVLEHPQLDVAVYTLYGHLSAIEPGLKVGQSVTVGATIATMGHSGTENIPKDRAHMHFEIGLRLTDNFKPWYDSKKFGSPNEHGIYNGMNLIGADPQAFFELVRAGKLKNFSTYISDMPTAFTLRVTTSHIPDFIHRYPTLLAYPVPLGGVGGWEVEFTWFGMPKRLSPLPPGAPGLGAAGAVTVVSFDPAKFVGCTCRDTLLLSTSKNSKAAPKIGVYLEDNVKLLFGLK